MLGLLNRKGAFQVDNKKSFNRNTMTVNNFHSFSTHSSLSHYFFFVSIDAKGAKSDDDNDTTIKKNGELLGDLGKIIAS